MTLRRVHFYNEDYPPNHELAPLCKQGRVGDQMTFFTHETTCKHCRFILDTPVSHGESGGQ